MRIGSRSDQPCKPHGMGEREVKPETFDTVVFMRRYLAFKWRQQHDIYTGTEKGQHGSWNDRDSLSYPFTSYPQTRNVGLTISRYFFLFRDYLETQNVP